jgi:hypothetical protein
MRNLLIGLLGAAVLGTGGYAAASGLDDADPARTVSLPGATTATDTTTASTGTTTTDGIDDVSGPCDEAEHVDDPRCTGGVATGEDDDDHGERGGDDENEDDDHDDNDDDDRSGSNSGRG